MACGGCWWVSQEELSWEQVEAAIWDDDVELLEPHIQTNFQHVYADRRTGFLLEVRGPFKIP